MERRLSGVHSLRGQQMPELLATFLLGKVVDFEDTSGITYIIQLLPLHLILGFYSNLSRSGPLSTSGYTYQGGRHQ